MNRLSRKTVARRLTQINADERLGISPLRICVHQRDLRAVPGSVAVLPPWAFAPWQCKSSQSSILKKILTAHRLELDSCFRPVGGADFTDRKVFIRAIRAIRGSILIGGGSAALRPCVKIPLYQCVLAFLLLASPLAQAQFTWTTNADNTITITGYTGFSGEVTIPATITGLPVTSIAVRALYGSFLTNVTIPGSVTNIGDDAFEECGNLANVTISDGITRIGDSVFAGCWSLTNFAIPNSVTSIGANAFYNAGLTSITIPNSVTSIGNYAFSSCPLTSVAIPYSVTSIGDSAFYSCSSLTTVAIPGSVTNIGDYAFQECAVLTAITVDTQNLHYSDLNGVLFDTAQTTLVAYPGGLNGSHSIPDGVTNFGSAFEYCANLTSITTPTSVTAVGDFAFYECLGLTNVLIANGAANIGSYAFYSCWNLTSISAPESVTNIGTYAFAQTGLTSVTIPAGITSLGDGAFSFCPSLTNATIPVRVSLLGSTPFYDCTSLTTITVDGQNSSYSSVNGVLFDKNQGTLLEYPAGLNGNYTIPGSVTSIGDSAFAYSGLTQVAIPDSVTNIGAFAFEQTGLISVTIPAGVTTVLYRTFLNCHSLSSVYFKGNAPPADLVPLWGDSNATAYYLPGSAGWSHNIWGYSGPYAVLWNPLIQTGVGSFGVQNGQFGFNITGTADIPIAVEACTNLANPVWTPLATMTLTNGSVYFSEPVQTNNPSRFYRIGSP